MLIGRPTAEKNSFEVVGIDMRYIKGRPKAERFGKGRGNGLPP